MREVLNSRKFKVVPKTGWIEQITHAIHKYFLAILLLCYALAAVAPAVGLWLRSVQLGRLQLPGHGSLTISASLLMLSFLLFNAGLGIKIAELKGLFNRPAVLLSGFFANLLLPLIVVLALRQFLGLWHSSDELQNLLVGVALIAAMPIAGSSTAWSQNANGNVSLSLGLVMLSTICSPFTTPWVLNVFGGLTTGDYSSDLVELAHQGTNAFMCLTVVLPSILGILVHFLLGEKRTAQLKPSMKLCNFIFLLMLNYSNASLSLPEVVKNPDWDFLGFVYGVTLFLCVFSFFAGWLLAKFFRTDQSEKASLMFGLGMNNNGTGLVLASMTLADHPAVMLPMIFYTLAQQVLAAAVDLLFFRSNREH
jgi:BASS family bile acid:Na+ symporter